MEMNSCQIVFRVKLKLNEKSEIEVGGTQQGESNRARYTRKTHRKSRDGCAACKKRRKKCDEKKPTCTRCLDHRLDCEYAQSKIVTRTQNTSEIASIHPLKWPGIQSPSVLIKTASPANVHHTNHDLFLLDHFMHNLGIANAGPEYALQVAPLVLDIAKSVPFLMHAMLALAACHLQYTTANGVMYRMPEALHTQLASQGLRQAITTMRAARDMDSVLTGSMLLNCLSFCYSSWRSAELGAQQDRPNWHWLRVQLGLKNLIIETKPFHEESIWLPMFIATSTCQIVGLPENDLDAKIAAFCDITDSSTRDDCPYLEFWERLGPLVARGAKVEHMRLYVDAIGGIDSAFVDLLEKEEVKALIMFAHWMALMLGITDGWIVANMQRECWKVCAVLDEKLEGEDRVLLEAPAGVCGYVFDQI